VMLLLPRGILPTLADRLRRLRVGRVPPGPRERRSTATEAAA
jgi:hypothetical protein